MGMYFSGLMLEVHTLLLWLCPVGYLEMADIREIEAELARKQKELEEADARLRALRPALDA